MLSATEQNSLKPHEERPLIQHINEGGQEFAYVKGSVVRAGKRFHQV